jgi:hypothetical protein
MICYSIRLLRILPNHADYVVTALRQQGLLAELKKEIPGHIGCSILESDLTNDLYLVIDFWRSKYDFFESEISPTGIFLTGVLDRLAYQESTLGSFSFPPPPHAIASKGCSEVEESTEVEDEEFVRS